MHERERRTRRRCRVHGPRPLPADPMNRMRALAEVSGQRERSPIERKPRVANAIRIWNQRIRARETDVRARESLVRRRPQNRAIGQREAADRSAERRQQNNTRGADRKMYGRNASSCQDFAPLFTFASHSCARFTIMPMSELMAIHVKP